MRNIKYLVVHCTASQPEAEVKPIIDYWKNVKKWNTVGYHFLIDNTGKVNDLLSVGIASNGVAGHNSESINICYIGGIDRKGKPADTRSKEQKEALITLLTRLKADYPKAKIVGHRDLSPDLNGDGIIQVSEWLKMCPSFDAITEYKHLN